DALEGSPVATADEQAHALLRTTALFRRMRSYPYVPGTAVLDESAPRQPVPDVWALCLMDGAESACLQTAGCISSVLARAAGAGGRAGGGAGRGRDVPVGLPQHRALRARDHVVRRTRRRRGGPPARGPALPRRRALRLRALRPRDGAQRPGRRCSRGR